MAVKHDITSAGQVAWPDVTVDSRQFAAHVTAVGASTTHLAGLYLAFACGAGDAAALRHLDQLLAAAVESALARRGFSASDRREVAQRLRIRLLAPPPRILEYAGRGELGAWLRVAALRLALNLRRETVRERALDDHDAELALACTGHDPETMHVAAESRAAFVTAFRTAFKALSARERNILRLHYSDAVELQDLAAAYAVHRVTIGRWIEAARAQLRSAVVQHLVTDLDVAPSEAARLVSTVRGDVSLRRLLPETTRV